MPGKDKEYGDDENSDDQDPASLDPTSEADVTENLSEEFIAERNRFVEWVFINEELIKHQKHLAGKFGIHKVEDAASNLSVYCLTGYGRESNQFQSMWQDIENPRNSKRPDPEKELVIYLKRALNSKCLTLVKPPIGQGIPIDIFELEYPEFALHDIANQPENGLIKAEFWNQIRECLKKHCRAKYLAIFIQIINLWEVGTFKPEEICYEISGLDETTYAARRRSIIEALKNNLDCWFNDEEDLL